MSQTPDSYISPAASPEEIAEFEAAAERMVRDMQLAHELLDKDPSLGFVTALIMAGDQLSTEKADARLAEGGPDAYAMACAHVGSYARMDWALRAQEAGAAPREQLLKMLPELWRGSDPDDTDPRFLALWKEAWEANGQRYVRDRRALPRKQQLTVYRGQDPHNDGAVPFGIAWTLDVTVADKFARGAGLRQNNRAGVIYTARVNRSDVLGYLTGRSEAEVIVDPDTVYIEGRGRPTAKVTVA